MSARFRIRTKEGQELSFASHEIFAEFVRSGDLSPDDIVYDAETREWSSAQTHPVVLQIQLEAEEAGRGGEAAHSRTAPEADQSDRGAQEGKAAPTQTGRVSDLDLAPAPIGLSPEEEAAAFVAKMEAERASEQIFEQDLGLKMERGSSSVVEELMPPAVEPPPEPTMGSRQDHSRSRRETLMAPELPEGRRPESRERPRAVPAPSKRGSTGRGGGRRYAPVGILAVVAVLAGVYFGPDLLGPGSDEGGDPVTGTAVDPPTAPPEIPATEEAVRARAGERFLTSTQAALRGLEQIPDPWLRGSYLAAPSDYPRVRDVWESYVTIIRDVRARDDERYRAAYLRALDDARVVEGGTRTLRLSAALSAFQAESADRAAHYDHVEELALTAIRGHDALVQAEGTIMYQPATGPVLSADPVIEAVGRTGEAQRLLNQVLDSILALLHAERGPGEARNVREWVWDGLLDAVTG